MAPAVYRWYPEQPGAGRSTDPAAARSSTSGAPITAGSAAVPAARLADPGQGLPSSGPPLPPPPGGRQAASAAAASREPAGAKASGVSCSNATDKTRDDRAPMRPAQETPHRILCLSMTLLILCAIMVILVYVNVRIYRSRRNPRTERPDDGESNVEEAALHAIDNSTPATKRIVNGSKVWPWIPSGQLFRIDV